MYGSGVVIGMMRVSTIIRLKALRKDRRAGNTGCCAAALGSTMISSIVRRTVAGAILRLGGAPTGSVACRI